jgi:S-DNA-T family DNA segregation ATPase FtsK/SpoIIIE
MVDRGSASPLPEKIGTLLQESRWLAVGAVALFLTMALWGFNKEDAGWSHAIVSHSMHNPAGRAGAWIADLMLYIFGFSAWWWIVLLGMSVWWGFRKLNTLGKAGQAPAVHCTGWVHCAAGRQFGAGGLAVLHAEGRLAAGPGWRARYRGQPLSRATVWLYRLDPVFAGGLMAAGWSIFSGMSWLWAFERLGAGWNQ